MLPCAISATLALLTLASAGGVPKSGPRTAKTGVTVSLWPPGATPSTPDAGPDRPVVVGVKFVSEVPGSVVGIRFHKAPANTGRHVASLWTDGGELLARATPRTETSAGWQRVDFPKPVAIEAGRMYVASYHSPTGHLSTDHSFFESRSLDRPPLLAPSDGASGPNGVYAYGTAETFPSQGHRASNYWVDVIFRPSPELAKRWVSVSVLPSNSPIALGDQRQMSAVATRGDGSSQDVSALVEWSSSDEAAITVTRSGVARALGRGAAALTARLGELSGTAAAVTISPPDPEEERKDTAPDDLTVSTASLPDAMVGVAYSAGLVAAGGEAPYRWAIDGELPQGLRLDALAGTVAGRPTTTGSHHLRLSVIDARGRTAAREVRLVLGPATFTIWPQSSHVVATSAGPDRASEAGVRFFSDVSGYVTAVRFHQAVDHGIGHVVRLWNRDGVLLAEARSQGKGARGWQEVVLPRPVAIEAGARYVASHRVEAGRLGVARGYFLQGVSNPPLHVRVGTPADVGGVFALGRPGEFPTDAHFSANPWVDVVFIPSAVPPALASLKVTPGDPELVIGEPRQFQAIGIDSRGAESDLTRLVRWESSDPADLLVETTGKATLLRPSTARVLASFRGLTGASRVPSRPLPPLEDEGPGGPILIVTGSSNEFSRYLAEILRTEGLNEFLATDVSRLDSDLLSQHDVLVLGDLALTDAQVATITQWVRGGGNLIAMRPDRRLASLLGLVDTGGVLDEGYVKITSQEGPGAGIARRSLQFHGSANLYRVDGATVLADLYRSRDERTRHPAVTLHAAGRGQAAAFSYDLARSVVYTRQGNPAWSGQARSGGTPRRSFDLFYGPASFDDRTDWVDFARIDVPQADEQQRLLVNLVLTMNMARRPLPRFWYLPSGHRAAVVLTADDHAILGPRRRFEDNLARSRPGCSLEDWECIRSTAYVYANDPLTGDEAHRYTALGFEISLHLSTACADFESRTELEALYSDQLSTFAANYPGAGRPRTTRTHCVTWSDFDTQPKVASSAGIRLDTNYYYWPASWVKNRPGFMTGSALPMRLTDRAGRIIDVFQLATQMTDESGQAYPFTVETLLDGALGPDGHYGIFTANMHTDQASSPGSDAIVAAAQARGVPVITARQMLDWLDARNASSFASLSWSGGVLRFTMNVAPGARNLQAMIPARVGDVDLVSVLHGASPVPFQLRTVSGFQYAVLPAGPGDYQATYR